MEMKYTIKDSVFTYLFRQPKYALQLYQSLHPEDTHVKEDDIEIVTIQNILANGIHNDLGMFVKRQALLSFMEAQSSFSPNISVRMLLYVTDKYSKYIEEQKLDVYSSSPVTIPRCELYVVYTGDRKNVPKEFCLSDLHEGKSDITVTVHVLQANGTGDIVDQYVRFCKISDEQRKKYGYTREAIQQTIDLCVQENVLAEFLASRKEEVLQIMTQLFDQEKVTQIREYNLAKQAKWEGEQEGKREGKQEGLLEGKREGLAEGLHQKAREVAKKMFVRGDSVNDIVLLTDLPVEEVEALANGCDFPTEPS